MRLFQSPSGRSRPAYNPFNLWFLEKCFDFIRSEKQE